MSDKNKEFVNLDNARHNDQRAVMEEIAQNEECPFCPEQLEKYHKQEILRKGAHWIITRNQWPYEHTDLHLLAIAAYHVEHLDELREGSFDELQGHLVWATHEFNVEAGGFAMRFGDIKENGATVRHLHAHLIIPSKERGPDDKVRFKIS
jgi:ATP adenylyltransferase